MQYLCLLVWNGPRAQGPFCNSQITNWWGKHSTDSSPDFKCTTWFAWICSHRKTSKKEVKSKTGCSSLYGKNWLSFCSFSVFFLKHKEHICGTAWICFLIFPEARQFAELPPPRRIPVPKPAKRPFLQAAWALGHTGRLELIEIKGKNRLDDEWP